MMNNFLSLWFPVIAWMILINPFNEGLAAEHTSRFIVPVLMWLFPSASAETIDWMHIIIRKITHFFDYAILAFLLFRAFRAGRKVWRPGWVIAAGVIALAYAGLDEFMQTMVAGRTGAVFDWFIDSAGVACALGMISIRKSKKVR
jgi:VanZ family protein